MPFRGWVINGTKYAPEEVVALAQRDGHFYRWPAGVWQALERQQSRSTSVALSASKVEDCPRQILLRLTEDYWLDPNRQWTALMGIGLHAALESGAAGEERFLTMPLPLTLPDGRGVDLPLRGRLDLYEADYSRLTDYKSIEEFEKWDATTRSKQRVVLPREGHIAQVNVYALLLEHHGHPVTSAQIAYLKRDKTAARKTVPVPLWAPEERWRYVVSRATPLALARETGQLPPCACRWRPDTDRDLCATVADGDWRGVGELHHE